MTVDIGSSSYRGTEPTASVHLLDFERYVREYQDRIFGFASYFLGNTDDAGDVTQDVLIRFWHHREEIDTDRLLPWLMRVTRNACIDHTRRGRSKYEVNGDDMDAWAQSEASPDRRLEQSEDERLVEAMLETIPEPYRSVVILREIQDLKYEEISGAMDMPLNTVKVYLHRGRKMLREQLKEVIDREHV